VNGENWSRVAEAAPGWLTGRRTSDGRIDTARWDKWPRLDPDGNARTLRLAAVLVKSQRVQ